MFGSRKEKKDKKKEGAGVESAGPLNITRSHFGQKERTLQQWGRYNNNDHHLFLCTSVIRSNNQQIEHWSPKEDRVLFVYSSSCKFLL